MEQNEGAKLQYFQQVELKKPSDMIIDQIRGLIKNGKLRPGDTLPSERKLAETCGVGRAQVREGLKRLEFFGILKTEPNKGTVVASLGVSALEGLISSVLQLDQSDVKALFETRRILEIEAARLAALRGTAEGLQAVRAAHSRFTEEVRSGRRALEEDHLFHLKIGEATNNSVLASLIGLVTPDIIRMNRNAEDPHSEYRLQALREHQAVMERMEDRDAEGAAEAMREHMRRASERRFPNSNDT